MRRRIYAFPVSDSVARKCIDPSLHPSGAVFSK
jgi:hypothetical protein